METNAAGKVFQDGETIIRQGEYGECMYVILEGQVEMMRELDEDRIRMAVRQRGEYFGEMGIFEREVRSATVRALGRAKVLALDKKNLLGYMQTDPDLAYRLVQGMARRIRDLNAEVMQLRRALGDYPSESRPQTGPEDSRG
jgi:CRP-like cAMP-binding protein